MGLIERLNNIDATIESRIRNHLGSDIEEFLFGPKEHGVKLKTPFLWVMTEDCDIVDKTAALSEDWTLYYWIISGLNPERNESTKDAMNRAVSLAIRASKSLMYDPKTGKENRRLDNLVSDIRRKKWSPADMRILEADEVLFGAGVYMAFKLLNKEGE
ncbi:MAG: hypothetical protein GY841_20105 [FCB group bacterium]|nr:hypothetical protein [FCB group bacterium]